MTLFLSVFPVFDLHLPFHLPMLIFKYVPETIPSLSGDVESSGEFTDLDQPPAFSLPFLKVDKGPQSHYRAPEGRFT